MFIAGVNNTADMLFTGITDIGGNISPVSLTPVIKGTVQRDGSGRN
jgi:hypothetical protein